MRHSDHWAAINFKSAGFSGDCLAIYLFSYCLLLATDLTCILLGWFVCVGFGSICGDDGIFRILLIINKVRAWIKLTDFTCFLEYTNNCTNLFHFYAIVTSKLLLYFLSVSNFHKICMIESRRSFFKLQQLFLLTLFSHFCTKSLLLPRLCSSLAEYLCFARTTKKRLLIVGDPMCGTPSEATSIIN